MSDLNTSPDTSLVLPAPADPSTEPRTDGKTQMDVDGKSVPFDHLGSMIINTDGVRSLTYMWIVHRLMIISRPVDDEHALGLDTPQFARPQWEQA